MDPPPYSFEAGGFRGELKADTLTLTPIADFPDREETLAAATALVRAWEIDAGLRYRGATIFFEHEYTATAGESGGVGMLRVSATGNIERQLTTYPEAPTEFSASSVAEELFRRYRRFRENRESVQAFAYACITKLETTPGGLKAAGDLYHISANVLAEIKKLASRPADLEAPRKYDNDAKPLTPFQREWLIRAIEEVIRKVAQSPEARAVSELTLNDLPKATTDSP
jgi:hypothetical protein